MSMNPSAKDISNVLSTYNIGTLLEFNLMKSGYANRNYRIITDAGTYLLRVCKEKKEEEILHEMKILGSLREIDFPAAYPLARDDGGFITRNELGFIVIYDFIEGNEPELNRRSVASVARAAAQLNIYPKWEGLRKENALSIELCRSVIDSFGKTKYDYPDLFDYFIEETEMLAKPLSEKLPKGLIHGDIFPDNTIYGGNDLLAIVDFEEVCTDSLLIDVGVTINGFCFRDNRLVPELLDVFLSEYGSVRPLSAKESELLPYYIRWGAHAMIGWHLKHLVRKTDPRKEERARFFMERIKRLRD